MNDSPNIEAFTQEIHKTVRHPEIILFGSRWTNTHRPRSDVDIVVVSPDFHALGLSERRLKIGKAIKLLGWQTSLFLRCPEQWEVGTGFLMYTVKSQVRDRDGWRRALDEFGRAPVLHRINARGNKSHFDIADIAAELRWRIQSGDAATIEEVERERRSLQQGGCCGEPSAGN